jgi:hypothetical protein
VDVHVRRSRASSSLSEMAEGDAEPSAKTHPARVLVSVAARRFCWRKRRFAGGVGDYGCFSATPLLRQVCERRQSFYLLEGYI